MSSAAKSLTLQDKLQNLERKLEDLTRNAHGKIASAITENGNNIKIIGQQISFPSTSAIISRAEIGPSCQSESTEDENVLNTYPHAKTSATKRPPPPLFGPFPTATIQVQSINRKRRDGDDENEKKHKIVFPNARSISISTVENNVKKPFVINGDLYQGRDRRFDEQNKRLEEITKHTGVLKLNGKEYKMEPNELIEVYSLGHGTCGNVVKMFHKQSGSFMAVKQMRRSGNKEENRRVIMDLDVVLRSHDCPYIVKCYGCFITDSDVWICMELMATCLDKLIKNLKKGLPERILGKITVSVLHALDYLKDQQGIMHRDIKPSNILLDCKGTVKLCDFGICGRLVDSKVRSRTSGCVAYMAPERIEPSNTDYDVRADVWSLGISLIELATGRFPYGICTTDFELLAKIVQEDPPRLTVQEGFTTPFCDFTDMCLTKNVQQRPKFKDLLETDFVKYYELKQVDVSSWFDQTMKETGNIMNT